MLTSNSVWLRFRKVLRGIYLLIGKKNPGMAISIKNRIHPLIRHFEVKCLGFTHNPVMSSINSNTTSDIWERYQSSALDGQAGFKVSIIVPNYNHSQYLRKRLESIYNQTYGDFEVILLDDCSTDDSSSILKEYYLRYSEKTSLIINEENSGGVFYQWQKGLSLAKGELVWIAESDDFCSEDFLEILVPYFINEAVTIAYSRTSFVKGDTEEAFWSIEEYLSDISEDRWKSAFVETANNIVAEAFSIKNIIPNVSSAVFRNHHKIDVLYDLTWQGMRTAGDWVLYLHLLRGGLIAYDPAATNYYRIHENNTSVKSYSTDKFYQEHELVAKTVNKYFQVNPSVFEQQKNNLIEHWLRTRSDYSDEGFERCYSVSRILEARSEKSLNILMAGFGFCAGGGETFPIMLANLMKRLGHNVTFLDCAQEKRIDSVRASLRSDIPVVSDIVNLNSIVADFDIDVIHSHHAWVDNTILDLLFQPSRARTVVTLHGMYETISDFDLKNILPRLVDRTSAFVYTADKNLMALKEHGYANIDNLYKIGNALDVYDFSPKARADLGINDSAFLLTIVSRAIPDKGWVEAISAVKYARKKYKKDIHLILIGEGVVYTELMDSGVPDYIHLLGFQQDIRSYFAASDFGFLPSRFEGESFPLVIIDCLHAGVPVLASSVGEIPYMLTTSSGLAGALFDLNDWEIDIEHLGDVIGKLSCEHDLVSRLQLNVAEAAKKFDPFVLAEEYDSVYKKAVALNH